MGAWASGFLSGAVECEVMGIAFGFDYAMVFVGMQRPAEKRAKLLSKGRRFHSKKHDCERCRKWWSD